jgi:hypothetical protein
VVICPKNNPAGLKELKDLAEPGLKVVLAAKEALVGQYALDLGIRRLLIRRSSPSSKMTCLKMWSLI